MKVRLLIATSDADYIDHLSRVLLEKQANIFDVTTCSNVNYLSEILSKASFDVALLERDMLSVPVFHEIRVPLLLWDGVDELPDKAGEYERIQKYQRISAICAQITQRYAAVSSGHGGCRSGRAKITVVWSPAGGVGKTTVALALAAKRASSQKNTVYFSLEPFSSNAVFFKEPGGTISTVFEKMDGNVPLLLQSISQEDTLTGIHYYGQPNNYDDIAILGEEDVAELLESCAEGADEVIVDLGSYYSKPVRKALLLADQVFLVMNGTPVCHAKCEQFRTQHSLYAEIQEKITVVANLGARIAIAEGETVLRLPNVETDDSVSIFRTLSGYID